MKTLGLCLAAAVLLPMSLAVSAAEQQSLDLRRGVPTDVYMAVHGKRNPERDFQRRHFEQVWETVKETKILEQALQIVTSRMSQGDLERAQAVLKEVQEAAATIDMQALLDCPELIYAQLLEIGTAAERQPVVSQHLFLVRLTPESATKTQEGIAALFRLVEKYSHGKAPVQTATEGDAQIVTLAVPNPVPFRPSVIRMSDVLLFSSSEELARRSLGMLTSGEGTSKFDDPRLQDALRHLPQPEDSLVFYDGKLHLSQMGKLADFIREVGRDDAKAMQIAGIIETVLDSVTIIDSQVTVEYTEGNLNRSASFGRLLPGSEEKLAFKALATGQPFENWQSWVPAESLSYSLHTGVNLHVVFEGIVKLIRNRIPEAEPVLERFKKQQDEWGVYVDRDILQAFSGEFVSVALPAATPQTFGGADSVLALRCHNPERIRELLQRLFNWLKEIPAVKMQEFQVNPCAELEGFEQISAGVTTMLGVKPVIGFHDGWLMIGSNADGIKKVLATRAGTGKTIVETDAFKQFQLEIQGPVVGVSYTNLAESIRQAAATINQVGSLLPMALAVAGAQANPEDLKPVQEVLMLLPLVSRIVAKFDFYEAGMSVLQSGDEPGTYVTRGATVVRQ
jgi:hypothetical protein